MTRPITGTWLAALSAVALITTLTASAAAGPATAAVDRPVRDVAAPVATITTPSAMAITSPVSVAFSAPVSGVSATSLRLVPAGGTVGVPATVTVPTSTTATLSPTSPLVPGQTYRLRVSSAVRGTGGAAVAAARTVRTTTVITPGSPAVVETWDPDLGTLASGGRYAKTATVNATSTVTYTGTSIALYGLKTHLGGFGHIYVDNALEATVSFYAPTTQWQALIWSTPQLSGQHTVKLVVQGRHEPASGGDWAYVDRWVVDGTSYEEASAAPGGPVTEGWHRRVATDARSDVTDVESMDRRFLSGGYPSAAAVVAGATVGVRFCRSPAGGSAYVNVNDVRVGTVNLYLSYTSCGYLGYSGPLRAGLNSVAVVPNGTVPAGSRGTEAALDSISLT